MRSHMGGHGFLESGVDVATGFFPLADTFQLFTDMQMGCVVTLAAYIGIEQAALGKI